MLPNGESSVWVETDHGAAAIDDAQMGRAGRIAPVVDVAHRGKPFLVGAAQRLGPDGIRRLVRRAARHLARDPRERLRQVGPAQRPPGTAKVAPACSVSKARCRVAR